jgi:TetR/AcrR family transcriptional regulator, regulator of biofilm formation and stress response
VAETTAQRRSERTRRRILDVTLDVIAEQGVRAVTQRRVAAAADTSVGLITYHFNSTRSMIAAALEQLAESETSRLAALTTAASELGGDRAALVELLVREVTEAGELRRRDVIASMALTLEIPRGSIERDAFDSWERAQQAFYEHVATALAAPAPEDFAIFLAATVDGLALYSAITTDPGGHAAAARLGLEQLLRLNGN